MDGMFNRLMSAQNRPMLAPGQEQNAMQAFRTRPQPQFGGMPPQAQGGGLGGVPPIGLPPQAQGIGAGGVPVNGMPPQAQGAGPPMQNFGLLGYAPMPPQAQGVPQRPIGPGPGSAGVNTGLQMGAPQQGWRP